MHRLYVITYAALMPQSGGVGIGIRLDYKVADSGDDVSSYGWQQARRAFPESAGFIQHRVMVRTVDDETVEDMLAYKGGLLSEEPT